MIASMKRTSRLQSKKQLKSGTLFSSGLIKPKKKKKKISRERLYHSLVSKARTIEKDFCCFEGCVKPNSDPHHTKGRLGDNLFEFIFLCREHHILVHSNKTKYKQYHQ